jgi:hypothetical protein
MRDPDSRLPQWWSDAIEAAWGRSRDAAIVDWRVRGDQSTPIESALVEDALAFGHGARSAFPHQISWDTLCPQLRADWIRLGHVGPAAWDQVAEVVRHEWLRAGGPS